ncbi:exonuclease domain-containing protein [Viridibacillus sp. FSL R5-0477]|uniref:Exonuclease domain-containing protein n=1 Tax=Viridibacillus arenosi FSL R5-213 TaxID=1227360 RepID=W4F056_9BACL|nr:MULTISPECIES: exonuclease domain-containing protein [Viridibacillus]ETT86165.1 hypothetical protein C176_05612 [Viridibacillus arenosi FSL R5-213]OMC84932.1 DNA polymerase III subunit epsilon [Viridibacillus sp. FSL H8-0123]OMC85729.1 DNA polymerase III subunit epsilon [Viridibacillus sp. FSL H7-0596]OMC91977.1 DNA polymerase III subunit epsilon [Viridibacillus arenosi]
MVFEPFIQLLRGIQGKRNTGRIGDIQNSQQMAYLRHLQKEVNQDKALNTPLHELNVVVFDIETTGFSPEKGDGILSIGAIKMSGEIIKEEEAFYSLVHFDRNIPQEIIQLTGITNEQLIEAPSLSEVLIHFLQFKGDCTLVAHHANHERNFMQHASSKLFRTPFKHRIVDTSFLYKIVEPKSKNVKLEDLCEQNGISVVNRHHALGDAKLTAELWSLYVAEIQQLGCKTLNDVYERFSRI